LEKDLKNHECKWYLISVTEEQALYQIFIDEQFGNVDKTRDEEKKK
jgi:hypothetical protein